MKHNSNGHTNSMTETETMAPVQVVWRNVALFAYLHAAALYGCYLMIFQAKLLTAVWAYLLYNLGLLGITAGAHRLWSHRTYSARLPLRILLAIFNSIALQNDIYEWARDHRVHHKFSETDADPHNAKRGFFFAHMGWLLCRKHPDVLEKGKVVDCSDILQDPVVAFQKKYYLPIVILMCFFVPTVVARLWGESYWNAFFVCAIFRYTITLHITWLVNSVAHLWGDRPYDDKINPSERLSVVLLTTGEGFHNYHHTFPWDYAASEWGGTWNLTTKIIDMFAKLGLAYNLKKVSQDIVDKRRQTKGDGSEPWYPHYHHHYHHHQHDDQQSTATEHGAKVTSDALLLHEE